jgi:hypothetical protein
MIMVGSSKKAAIATTTAPKTTRARRDLIVI